MTYLEIQAFLAIADTGSLSKAAKLLFISQPALSYRLQALEKELDCQVIDRRQGIRKATLTDAGVRFVPIAERWKQLWEETQGLQAKSNSVLKIGAASSINSYVLPQAYQQFLYRKSPYSLNILTQSSTHLYQSIENKALDVAFLANPMYSNKVITTPLFKEEMLLLCSADMGIPDEIHPATLDPKQQITIPWNQEFKTWNNYWFGNKGQPLIYTDNVPMLESFLVDNQGWAVVPVSVTNNLTRKDELKTFPIIDGPPDRISYMITNEENIVSETLLWLIEDIKNTTRNHNIKFLG